MLYVFNISYLSALYCLCYQLYSNSDFLFSVSKVKYHGKLPPYFFLSKGVCHGLFRLFGLTQAARNAKQARITNLKSIAHGGIRTWYLPVTKQTRNKLRHEI